MLGLLLAINSAAGPVQVLLLMLLLYVVLLCMLLLAIDIRASAWSLGAYQVLPFTLLILNRNYEGAGRGWAGVITSRLRVIGSGGEHAAPH